MPSIKANYKIWLTCFGITFCHIFNRENKVPLIRLIIFPTIIIAKFENVCVSVYNKRHYTSHSTYTLYTIATIDWHPWIYWKYHTIRSESKMGTPTKPKYLHSICTISRFFFLLTLSDSGSGLRQEETFEKGRSHRHLQQHCAHQNQQENFLMSAAVKRFVQ